MAQSERTISALRSLAAAFTDSAGEMVGLAGRAEHLARELESGTSLSHALVREPRPLMVTRLTQLGDLLTHAGAEVRRAEAHQLRDEALTQEAIAELFGVSRQRVAALLKPRPAGARGPFRPAPSEDPGPTPPS